MMETTRGDPAHPNPECYPGRASCGSSKARPKLPSEYCEVVLGSDSGCHQVVHEYLQRGT